MRKEAFRKQGKLLKSLTKQARWSRYPGLLIIWDTAWTVVSGSVTNRVMSGWWRGAVTLRLRYVGAPSEIFGWRRKSQGTNKSELPGVWIVGWLEANSIWYPFHWGDFSAMLEPCWKANPIHAINAQKPMSSITGSWVFCSHTYELLVVIED